MIKVDKVTKKFGSKTILQSLSFQMETGSIVGLVGENGAGKSTLLHLLATLHVPSSGTIYMDQYEYVKKNLKTIRKNIGYVPQEIALWENFSVKENMKFFEKLSPVRKSLEELHRICKNVHLDKWEEKVSTLSGGMKRKLNIAISLIHEPKYLFLDEPTVGIDLKSKVEIGKLLKQLSLQENITIVYISHDMDEIIQICDFVYHLGNDLFYKQILEERGLEVISL